MDFQDFGIVLNEASLEAYAARPTKTFIMSGSSRGGTSLLGYTMHMSNVHLGDVRPNTHEPECLADKAFTMPRALEHVRKLKTESPLVGAKFPGFTPHLKEFDDAFDDCIFLYVFRNPLDIAKTIMKRSPNHKAVMNHLKFGIDHAFKFYHQFIEIAPELTQPALLISYESARARPRPFLRFLEQFGVEFEDLDFVAKQISRPGYKTAETPEKPAG